MALSVSLLRELSGIDGTAMEEHSISKLLKRLQSNPNINISGLGAETKDLTLYGSVSIYAYVTEYLIETARQVYDTDCELRIDSGRIQNQSSWWYRRPQVTKRTSWPVRIRKLWQPLIQAANLVNYIVKRYGGHVEFSSRELRVVLPTKPSQRFPG